MTKNVPAYNTVQIFKGLGRVEARTAKVNGVTSHRLATIYLGGTRMVGSCCILGLTDEEAVAAFPAFRAHALALVQEGKNVHHPEIRRLLQLGIIAHLGKGTPGRLMDREVKKRDLLPLNAPLLPLDSAPMPAPDFRASAALGDAAARKVEEAAGQVNLTDRSILQALQIVRNDPSLTAEERANAMDILFSKASGNPLERTPESIAAFALTSAMDRTTKGQG